MSRDPNILDLVCPSCGAAIALTAPQLVVGVRVRCLHCNAEALVIEEFDELLGRKHWALDDTDDELPQEP
jgi:predicted Zn finger-like uncharacterized protein